MLYDWSQTLSKSHYSRQSFVYLDLIRTMHPNDTQNHDQISYQQEAQTLINLYELISITPTHDIPKPKRRHKIFNQQKPSTQNSLQNSQLMNSLLRKKCLIDEFSKICVPVSCHKDLLIKEFQEEQKKLNNEQNKNELKKKKNQSSLLKHYHKREQHEPVVSYFSRSKEFEGLSPQQSPKIIKIELDSRRNSPQKNNNSKQVHYSRNDVQTESGPIRLNIRLPSMESSDFQEYYQQQKMRMQGQDQSKILLYEIEDDIHRLLNKIHENHLH